MEAWQAGGFGLYIHWPFCQAKCPYCDFNSHVAASIDQSRWAEAFLWNLDRLADETDGRILETVYFGGGTPSLMLPSTVDAILSKVRSRWRMVNDVEITLEANPSSVEADRFLGYRDAGVNRVSLGVQALNETDLKALGRLHSVFEARKAIEVAQSVFDRVSFDLIYARQNQSEEAWKAELRQALAIGTDHLSLYQLTVEEGTAFASRLAVGGLKGLPDEDLSVAMFEITQELTSAAGLPAYEVSNHARPGQESRHNLIYWNGGDYLGCGPGAHGRLSKDRFCLATAEMSQPGAWLSAVSRETPPEQPREKLSKTDRAEEMLMMGLRLTSGVDLSKIERLRGDAIHREKLQSFQDDRLLELAGNQLRTTASGRLVLNAILRDLLIS